MRTSLRSVMLAACLLPGCVPGRVGAVTLYVSLRTDFVPGEEFATVRVVATTNDGRQVSEDEVAADPARPYVEGAAILETPIAPGPYLLEVTLLGRQGAIVARRRVAVEAAGAAMQQAVTVVIARGSSCVEAECGEEETCGPSGCVNVHCTPETPESCPPTACTGASDCPARAACASAACASGACLYGARDGACGAGEWCHAEDGCVPRTSPVGDTGRPCTGDGECSAGVCVDTGAGESACTTECESESDCMSGWTCGPVEGAPGDVCLCTAAGPEVCSGVDEDCDGSVDEDGVCSADVGTPCGDGESCASGVCASIGEGSTCTVACRGTGDCLAGWVCGTADGAPGGVCRCLASAEACNGLDDDCDGRIDESGVCGVDGPSCTTEICNLADDDCDSYCDDGAACRKPVHRAFNPGTSQHIYSDSLIEITSRPALSFEAQDYFQVYLVPQPGLVPLHRCLLASRGSYFLSLRADCEGATHDSMIGFVAPTPTCQSVPLFELRSATPGADFVYTVSGPERQDLLADGDFQDFGVVAHVWPSEVRCTTPVDENCTNGLDDDCDGLTDCADAYDCCSSGQCSGIRSPGAYRIRCCERGWVNIARSENHCGGCNGICQAGHFCNPDGAGSGHCGCDATNPWCARGQSCVEQNTPRDGTLGWRCTCLADDQCAYTFECRGLGDGDNVHNVCHPTL